MFRLTLELTCVGGAGITGDQALHVALEDPLVAQDLVDVNAVVLGGVSGLFFGGQGHADQGAQNDGELHHA